MKLIKLDWDSNFFKLNVYALYIEEYSLFAPLELMQRMEDVKADLVYIFTRNNQLHDQFIQIGAKLMDEKVTYEKMMIDGSNMDLVNVQVYTGDITPSLMSLAFSAGEYSRFKVDPELAPYFKELYTRWIENSINGSFADKVFIISNANNVRGMVTCKIKDNVGSIGLIATEAAERGKGYGKQLMQAVENFYTSNNTRLSTVVTQLNNKVACKFYEKCGYSIQKIEYVYHCWIK